MRALTALMMLALLAAPVALAQDEKTDQTDRPDDAAWVDDCPPDMMCAAGAGDPQAYGNESCIECSGPAPTDGGSTCMDGEQENETCRDDVYYLGGGEPTRGPADGSCENCRGNEAPDTVVDPAVPESAAQKAVPIPAALVIIAVAAALVFVAIRR